MNDIIQNFLLARFPISGLAAFSVRSAEGVLGSQCISRTLQVGNLDDLLGRIIKNARTFLPAGHHSARYCWMFDAHHVYIASRPDGFSLALVTEKNVQVEQATISEIIRDFLDLQDG